MEGIDISIADEKTIGTDDLRECLINLGIKKGDSICVHSHLLSFGKPLLKRQDFMKAIVNTLKDVIGEKGTLIMPTFTYSFCHNEVYDMDKSPSTVGILTEYYRNLPDVKRTWHPIFSFGISGSKKEDYLDIGPDAFSLDSVYGKLMQNNGKLVMLGGNFGYTFYYLAEEHVNVTHRYFKSFTGKIITPEKSYVSSVPYFVRNLDIKSELNEEKLSLFLLEKRCQKQMRFAKGTIAVIECKEMYYRICNALRMNERVFL